VPALFVRDFRDQAGAREVWEIRVNEIVRICGVSDLPGEGEVREFEAAGQTYCLARVNGRISALDNVCLHQGGPLGQGVIEAGKVVCPWHGWQFDALTGICVHAPKHGVAVYEVAIESGDVLLRTLPQAVSNK
jgi:nitrite reductase (NADH) small subunit